MARRPGPRRLGFLLGAALLLGAGTWVGVSAWIRSAGAARLPRPPDPGKLSPALAEEVARADGAARARPWSAGAVGRLGMVYHANLFYGRARACYRRAEELDGGDERWPYLRALLLAERGEVTPVVRLLERVVRIAPRHALAWYRLGDARYKAADFEGAAAAFVKAEEITAEDGDPARGRPSRRIPVAAHAAAARARILMNGGRLREARDLLWGVVRSAPRFGLAHRLLGNVVERLGDPEEAKRQLAAAVRCPRYSPPADPLVDELTLLSHASSVLLKQATLAKEAGNLEWEERLLALAASHNPGDPDSVAKLAEFHLDQGHPEKAVPALLANRRRDPRNRRIGKLLAECMGRVVKNLLLVYRAGKAEETLRGAIREAPGEPILHGMLADLLVSRGRYDEAAEEFRAALRTRDDPEVRTRLGAALLTAGRGEEGRAELRKVLEASPDHPGALIHLLEDHTRRGRYEEAEAVARRLEKAAPSNPFAHLALAELAARRDRVEEARRHCRRALALKPDLAAARELLSRLPR